MKADATLSSMTSVFQKLLGDTGTLTTLVIITNVSQCHPTPDSDLVLCLKPSCVSSYRPCPCYETPAPDLSNPAVSEYRMSGPRLSLLTLINRGRPSLSPFPSLCLQSRLASPTLTSTNRASHHTPDQVTGLRGFYVKTQINLPICIQSRCMN